MSRINTDDPKFFDWWRENYYTFTVEENIEIGNQLEGKYPGQASFNTAVFDQFFQQRTLKQMSVLEIGGWKGELAQHCFQRHAPVIKSWHNIDMCKAAVEKSIQMNFPYTAFFPSNFDWFKQKRAEAYDVCISAHTIEHLANDHLMELIDYIAGIPTIIFEAPIAMEGQSWDGYYGTHMLTTGWSAINRYMLHKGYLAEKITDWAFIYKAVS